MRILKDAFIGRDEGVAMMYGGRHQDAISRILVKSTGKRVVFYVAIVNPSGSRAAGRTGRKCRHNPQPLPSRESKANRNSFVPFLSATSRW